MDDKVRAHVIITGRVQGVFFRMETQRAAQRIGGVTGWVRNKRDGSVEALFEGDKTQVGKVLEWCHVGSPNSNVKNVNVEWEEYAGEFSRFDVTY